MSGQTDLERAYRRLLAWYPPAFRRENEEEILAVLLACAADGQRRPGPAASADLIKGAVRMWLRPTVPHTARTLLAAVKLMYAGAALELTALVTIIATTGSVRSAVTAHEAAQWPAVLAQLRADEIAAAVATGAWLWLAWANGRGRGWARAAFLVFCGLGTVSIMGALAQQGTTYAPADVAVGAALWLVQVTAAVLVLTPQADRGYRCAPVPR